MVNYFSSSISTPKHRLYFLQLSDLHTQYPFTERVLKSCRASGQAEPLKQSTTAPRDIKEREMVPALKKKSLGAFKPKKSEKIFTLNTQTLPHLPPPNCEVSLKCSVLLYKEASCSARRMLLDQGTQKSRPVQVWQGLLHVRACTSVHFIPRRDGSTLYLRDQTNVSPPRMLKPPQK